MQVPKPRRQNLEYRHWLLSQTVRSRRLRQELREHCSQDILFWINSFVFTFDPRTPTKFLPMITWPIQDQALTTILECIRDGIDLVIEKSRDMGASWLSLLAMDWLYLYHPGNTFLMVSRKEDLVDAPGDPDSLFWKLDFVHRHLPEWLLPLRTDRRRLHFGNLDNGSTVDGESTTAAAGVGGRRTAMFIDEFSRIEEGAALLAGTADTTRCRIFNFTPYGTNNAAYRLAKRNDVRKLRLHWSDHPEKAAGLYQYNTREKKLEVKDKQYAYPPEYHYVLDGRLRSPWYDNECLRRANEREIAQMLDIDYQGSAYQFFDRGLILNLQEEYSVPPVWEGDISLDTDTGRPLELVKLAGGPLKLWINPDVKGALPPSTYTAGADLAVGTGATNSVLSFFDCASGRKVGVFASPHLRPEQMAPRSVALCWLFKDQSGMPALFAWEMQGPGITFGKRVIELGYRNVYFRTAEHALNKKVTDIPGWVPTPDNKRTLLEEYRAALATRRFINPDEQALEECLEFIHTAKGTVEHAGSDTSDDPTGARVNHGDRVIPDALAWKMAMQLGYGKRDKEKDKPKVFNPSSLAWRRTLADNESKHATAW